jgi:hypothetical protein
LIKKPKTYTGERTFSSTNYAGQAGLSTYRTPKIDANVFSCTKVKFKWITDINIEPETLKLLWKN